MGKEEDSLLLFLSMEKQDLESCKGMNGEGVEEQRSSIWPEDEGPAPSFPVFWICVATSLLLLSLVSGAFQFCPMAFQFCPKALCHHEAGVQLESLRGAPISGFVLPRFSSESVSSRDEYQGQAIVHDGRAYLTSQFSIDDKGVVAKAHSVGRLIHSQPLRMKQLGEKPGEEIVASFHTTFVFSIENSQGDREATGDGFAFVMVPEGNVMGSAGGNLGVVDMNSEDEIRHTFAVEFDTWKNPSLRDVSNNHVGINVNSMVSLAAEDAGYWTRTRHDQKVPEFRPLDLTSGEIQAWIEYDSISQELTVSLSPNLGLKPVKPLLKTSLDLSKVLNKYMSVGFSAATGQFAAKHVIHSWQFEKSSAPQHWTSATNVAGEQVPEHQGSSETSANFQAWQSVSVRRDHVAKMPMFRNPHKHRHGDSMFRPSVTTTTTTVALPTLAAEEAKINKPVTTAAATKKPCAGHFLGDFSSMDFPTFKEHLVFNSLWVLMGLASGLLFFHLVIITYRILVGCFDAYYGEKAEGSKYSRVFDETKESTKEVGYVLVVTEDHNHQQQHQHQQSEERPSARV